MRRYHGEWADAYALLKHWGEWHWANRDRMGGLGYPTIAAFYAAAYGPSGGRVELELPEMDAEQCRAEDLIRRCPESMQKLAKFLFCDYPVDSWQMLAKRKRWHVMTLHKRKDALLIWVSGAMAG